MGFKPDTFGGAVKPVGKVVHDVVADVIPACDNLLVLYMVFTTVERCGRPSSLEARKWADHERGIAIVVVFKLGVFAVNTISHGPSSWVVGFRGTA